MTSRLLVGFLLLIPAGSSAQQRSVHDPDKTAAEEFKTPEDLRQGRQTIMAFCSRCHGLEGRGSKGPDLTNGKFRHGATDQEIYDNIVNGIPGTGMPAFVAKGRHVWQVINYLRAQEKAAEAINGDKNRGAKLFVKHKCNSCHWTGEDGGRRGVDFTRMYGPVDYLRKSILHPNDDLDIETRTVIVHLTDGRVLTGIRRFENAYHLLLIDENEQLRSIAKKEVEQFRVTDTSLMPDFKQALSKDDVEDLIAFIVSLRKD